MTVLPASPRRAVAAWALGAAFFCYGFFHRVSPSVMVEDLMREFDVGAAVLGNLSAFYFYAYAAVQIPVGLLLDRFGPRRLLTASTMLCALGALLFGYAGTLSIAYAGRTLVGLGAAFSWVGLLTIVTLYFPATRFARLVGLAQMLGMVGAVFGQGPLAAAVAAYGWRGTLAASAAAGLVLALAFWTALSERPARPTDSADASAGLIAGLRLVARNPNTWYCALYCGAMTAPTLAFIGLWGVPWLVQVHGLGRAEAASLASLGFVGFGLGAPTMGWLSDTIGRRRIVMVGGSSLALMTLVGVFYLSGTSMVLLSALILAHGFSAGAMVVGFAAVREHNPPETSGAAYGLVNTFAVGSGALFQPLLGVVLDLNWRGATVAGARLYDADAYGWAFATLLIGSAVGAVAALRLAEIGPRR